MPRNELIKKVLVIGSGPIVIGQGAEFDYAGTQACHILREEKIEIVLVNSNPATIMTDQHVADIIYIEPLTVTTIKRIIEKERPDSILSGFGGQTSLTLCMQLAREGFLTRMNVKLLGSTLEAIEQAEDRQRFKETMQRIGQPVVPSVIACDINEALLFADETGFPLIVRPAYTLGGSGGGIAHNVSELKMIMTNGLKQSPIHQVLVEQSIAGWKEIEFEVMRDQADNVIVVCSMENMDPVGIHTGDSIVIAPAVTLADKEYQMLRTASLNIIRALGVSGGCNCQFALDPSSFEYAVIEVNPRVSRSSALASKATGYPIAKVATQIAIGYRLDEIINRVTGTTCAAFEPALDYVAVKYPKWPFDKFVYADRRLGTQMKSTGEVLAMSDTFTDALTKAVRGSELGLETLDAHWLTTKTTGEIRQMIRQETDQRLFVIYEAIKRGIPIDEITAVTKIDRWFLFQLKQMSEQKTERPDQSRCYKMVDTCGGEFAARTPYFYATGTGSENEALPSIQNSLKPRVVVLGSGPIRIGQGIEFDYACVHCIWTLKQLGYETIVINNNPSTVSTDFDTGDRLYFEPLCFEDVMPIIEIEKPVGVVVAFGGGTALKLTRKLYQHGVAILGTSADNIDRCEDRERFDALLEQLSVKRPEGLSVQTEQQALLAAEQLGYPVLIRPSYVLGGQNMIIAFSPEDVSEYMQIILRTRQDYPILIDKYLSGIELEVDAICDGTDVLIPGIMEHIERTGIHSGDSIATYPAVHVDDDMARQLFDVTQSICLALPVLGLVNIQYVLHQNDIYVIEVNPRASRTVPYLSKVTGIPMCEVATRVITGQSLKSLGYQAGICRKPPYVAVKVPVFSFEKLIDVDTHLGPEMKSTGEVLGIGRNLREALVKGLIAAGYQMRKQGGVLITVRDSDKADMVAVAAKLVQCGFSLYATSGTARLLNDRGLLTRRVNKIHENSDDNTATLLDSGQISYIISTSEKGRNPASDDVRIRRKACSMGIPCLTSVDTANALADSLLSGFSTANMALININQLRDKPMQVSFSKMQTCGNDYIYIDCFADPVEAPESLPIFLADRHYGVGSDGIVLILPSDVADAKMRVFNRDGSEGRMGGNAIRCVAKYLYDHRMIDKRTMRIETASGIRELAVRTTDGMVTAVTVNMGRADLKPAQIPVNLDGDDIISRRVEINGESVRITCVSMGNPHVITFRERVDALDLQQIGPVYEMADLFPDRVNAEFVEWIDRNKLKVRVWERGSGETLACGTGACAAAVAAVLNGLCDRDTDIVVQLLGGQLTVRYSDGTVYLTGDCINVFEGTVSI